MCSASSGFMTAADLVFCKNCSWFCTHAYATLKGLPEWHSCEHIPSSVLLYDSNCDGGYVLPLKEGQWQFLTRTATEITKGGIWTAEHGTDYAVEQLCLLVDRWSDRLGTQRTTPQNSWVLFDSKSDYMQASKNWPCDVTEPPLNGDFAEMLTEFWAIGWEHADPLRWLTKICGLETES